MRMKDFMTPCPYTVGSSASLDEALNMMELRSIRHLPVVENGQLIGIVSHRDIETSQFVCETTKYCPSVGDVCSTEPIVVQENSSLSEVASRMANEKKDCALVSDEFGNFVGIFTTIDACRAVSLLCGELVSVKRT